MLLDKSTIESIEALALEFAGHLTSEYIETVSLLISLSGDDNVNGRTELLMKVRETELAKVDVIERELKITPRTAEIRRWYREQT